MYVIPCKELEKEMEIKKSKFITKLYKVYTLDEALKILIDLRRQYRDATHICYAYIIGRDSKYSDDGEPGGTAGLPMMQVLINKKLDYTLAVTIRYFGGIKLGSGGLVRAYTKGLSELLNETTLNPIVKGYEVEITCPYEKGKELDYALRNVRKLKREYGYFIKYIFQIPKDEYDTIKDKWTTDIRREILMEKDPNQKF